MRSGSIAVGAPLFLSVLATVAFAPTTGCARAPGRTLRAAAPAQPVPAAPAVPAPSTSTGTATGTSPQVANAAVVTMLSGSGSHRGVASGFLVAPDRVVTCLHVVDGDRVVRVRYADRTEAQVLGVLAEDRAHDLVLLAVPPTRAQPLVVADEPVAAGTTLHAVGTYHGCAQTAATVEVTRAEQTRKRLGRAYRARGRIGPGSSGCPLLDDQGRVRGVVAEQDLSGADVGLVVPGRFVKALAAGPLESMDRFGARTAANPDLTLRDAYEDALKRLRSGDREGARRGAERVYAEGRARGSIYAWNAVAVLRDALAARPEEAVARLGQIVAENPTQSEPAVTLGNLLWELGRREESIATLRDAARREPGEADPHAFLALKLALVGRSAEADAEARAALAVDPDALPALSVAGNVLVANGRTAEALGPFGRAAILAPDSAEARVNYGAALANTGHPAEGRAHLEAAVRLEPELALAHENLARVHVATGDLAAARHERDLLLPLDRTAAADITALIARAESAPRRAEPPPAPPPAVPVPPVPGALLPPPVTRRVG